MAEAKKEMISYAGRYQIVCPRGTQVMNPSREELGTAVMVDPKTLGQSWVSFLIDLGERRQPCHNHQREWLSVIIRRIETRSGTKVWFKGYLPKVEYLPGTGVFPITPHHDKTYSVTGTYDVVHLDGVMTLKVYKSGIAPLTYRAQDSENLSMLRRHEPRSTFVPEA